jgi:3-hydroxy-9,10-secoandrosta-1,3,5(10)-triene-9,17-dione monooxygenase reductase component
MSFSALDFRKTLSRFATGVAVGLTQDSKARFYGVTLNSLTSVSLEPPLILFCLKSTSESCFLFQESKQFSLNILSSNQSALARRFAHKEQKWCKEDEVTVTSYGLPKLHGCIAYLYCRLESVMQAGDHKIFLCRVLGLETDEVDQKPLIFYHSQFGTTEIFLVED